jgi:hypothetical protein
MDLSKHLILNKADNMLPGGSQYNPEFINIMFETMIKYQSLYPDWLKNKIINRKYDLTFISEVCKIREHNADSYLTYLYIVYGI